MLAFRFVAPFAALALSAFALAATAPAANAQDVLLSNLENPLSTSGNNYSATSQKAVAFTTGASAYTLDSIQGYFSLNTGVASGNNVVVSANLYTPSIAGGNLPGTLAVSLGTQNITSVFANPTLSTFMPTSVFTLDANTRYVLLVDYVSGSSNATWDWRSGGANSTYPTARNNSGYNTPIYSFSNDNGASYSTSANPNVFALRGSAVAAAAPEPGTLPLIGTGIVTGLGMVGTVRRRKAKQVA